MKKSYECELAAHIGPESCGAARKGGGAAFGAQVAECRTNEKPHGSPQSDQPEFLYHGE
jgi:hypothetical protein